MAGPERLNGVHVLHPDIVNQDPYQVHGAFAAITITCGNGCPTPITVPFSTNHTRMAAVCEKCGRKFMVVGMLYDREDNGLLDVKIGFQDPAIIRPT